MISFVETKLFTRLVQQYLSDDEYSKLQQELIRDPEAGAIFPGSAGVRKVRVADSIPAHVLKQIKDEIDG